MVIADNLARLVDPVFSSNAPYHGIDVLVATYAFAFQIFCDFAGYSNIARGLAKCMGFDIMVNFNLPYFAKNPREFWQRWHISLSTWLRDYLYIPLGGNRKGKVATFRNIAVTMLLGGLWHGAAWTFVIWGAYQGVLLISHRLLEPFSKFMPSPKSAISKRIWFLIRVGVFFQLICAGWLVFRAQSMGQVAAMWYALTFNFNISILSLGTISYVIPSILLLCIVQLFQYQKNDLLFILKQHWAVRAIIYVLIFGLFLSFGVVGGEEFIYFQF